MNNRYIVENFLLGDKIGKTFVINKKEKLSTCFKISHPNKYYVWLPLNAIWVLFYDWYVLDVKRAV